MTILDKVSAQMNTLVSQTFDTEDLNHMETAALTGIIVQGRHMLACLSVLHNHAQDTELRQLIRQALEEETEWLVEHAERHLRASDSELPELQFSSRELLDTAPDIPSNSRFSDSETALALANLARVAQSAVLAAMFQTYQPEIQITYRKSLDHGLDFNHRLVQLMLRRGWLPHLPKVLH